MQDMVLDDSDDDVGPGPGQYYNADASAFMKSKMGQDGNIQMQFFGSTVERFADSRSLATKKGGTMLGPGHYD
jgi:hypothetical protein